MVASNSGGGTSVYGNLPYVLSVFQSITWWLDSGANVHVCSDALLFSSYKVTRDSSVLMENGSHASVCGVDMIDMKLTSGKIMQLKNVQHGFKVVIESNKFVVLKCGQFIDKCYVCGCLFHFLVSDFCNKYVNNIFDDINECDVISILVLCLTSIY
jgi:hypothetical protein